MGKGEGRRGKGEGRREKGEGGREKGEGVIGQFFRVGTTNISLKKQILIAF
ncbi:hypothetical protein FDUTEX481_05753 [Tolypothrix sp. PCC 7601]|nr:hypothetical protein FDUTEX481_05753 [Tolypothrix sp. PCC 7601]